MKQITLLLLLLSCGQFNQVLAQRDTTIYFSKSGQPVAGKPEADQYQTFTETKDNQFNLTTSKFRDRKWIETESSMFIPLNDTAYLITRKSWAGVQDTLYRQVQPVDSGFIISDFRQEILVARGFSRLVAPLIKEGLWIYYVPEHGGLDCDESYRNNELKEIRYWDEDTDSFITDVYTVAEVNPQFKGGDQALYEFLASQIVYPEEAKSKGQQGRVFVNFIIMEDGSVKRVKLLHAPSSILGQEAVRVVALTDGRWTPAMHRGAPVRTSYNLPIKFTLN